MRIAVYSGSFDPLHTGHLAILEWLTAEERFDMVYLVVSPQNPFKDPELAESARRRYEAACRAVARHEGLKVKVDDIELGMEPPQYTINTLDALGEREPGNSFTLVVGADNLDCILRWRSAEDLLTRYGLIVFPREGFDAAAKREELLKMNPDFRIEIADAPLVNISSSFIREELRQGRDVSQYLM